MSLKASPELMHFFSVYISEGDSDADASTAARYAETTSPDKVQKTVTQIKAFLATSELSVEDLGTEANRWFSDSDEAKAWLTQILSALESSKSTSGSLVVKDSNGAGLAEGDSVLVIKDLKVKGGTSDLKRGTMIKNIHLIDDVENIECRVDGSTLVLKCCFLKKA